MALKKSCKPASSDFWCGEGYHSGKNSLEEILMYQFSCKLNWAWNLMQTSSSLFEIAQWDTRRCNDVYFFCYTSYSVCLIFFSRKLCVPQILQIGLSALQELQLQISPTPTEKPRKQHCSLSFPSLYRKGSAAGASFAELKVVWSLYYGTRSPAMVSRIALRPCDAL